MDQASSYTNFGFLREIKENTTESCSTQSASDLKILLPTGSLYPIQIKFYDYISIFLLRAMSVKITCIQFHIYFKYFQSVKVINEKKV